MANLTQNQGTTVTYSQIADAALKSNMNKKISITIAVSLIALIKLTNELDIKGLKASLDVQAAVLEAQEIVKNRNHCTETTVFDKYTRRMELDLETSKELSQEYDVSDLSSYTAEIFYGELTKKFLRNENTLYRVLTYNGGKVMDEKKAESNLKAIRATFGPSAELLDGVVFLLKEANISYPGNLRLRDIK